VSWPARRPAEHHDQRQFPRTLGELIGRIEQLGAGVVYDALASGVDPDEPRLGDR
jgi:hypothetical protein